MNRSSRMQVGQKLMGRRSWRLKLKAVGYFSFLLPALVVWVGIGLGHATGWHNLFAFFPVMFAYLFIPLADYAIGKDSTNPNELIDTEPMNRNWFYPLLTIACLPIHSVIMLVGAFEVTTNPQLTWVGQLGWMMSIGLMAGIIAINVAHELVHKKNRFEQWVGGLLLSTVCYPGFKVEHVRGHHVNVATPEDASSARYNQSLYQFLPQAIFRNFTNAWKLEFKRLQKKGLPLIHPRNELLWWNAISVLIACFFLSQFGWLGLVYFVVQSLFAIIELESVNYVEHYGLHRRKLASGRYERPNERHSWNSNYLLTNLVLLQLQRHSDHHANPSRRYQVLRHIESSPQLPGGYASMVLLAWFPPLWRRVINPRVQAYYIGEAQQLLTD